MIAGMMTEDELRKIIRDGFSDNLPSDEQIDDWADATGFPPDEVKKIYGDEIGDPDPWGPMPIIIDRGDD